MKNTKCYGKKPAPKKEKSFITHFFDENVNSDSSLLFGKSSDEVLQKDSSEETKAISHTTNNPEQSVNTLQSPPIFENLSIENLSPEKSFEAKSGIKTTYAMKKKGKKKRKRCFRKKPLEVFHFSTKYCKKLQPRWSEIYKHDLTIERTGTSIMRSVTSRMQRNKMPSEHISFQNTKTKTTGFIQKENIKNIFKDDSLNSSGDLFETSVRNIKNSEKIICPSLNDSKFKQVRKESFVRKTSNIEKKLEQSLNLGNIVISPKHKLHINENLYTKSSLNCAIPMTIGNETFHKNKTLGPAEIYTSSNYLPSEKSNIIEKENNSQKKKSNKRLEPPSVLGELEMNNIFNLNNSICLSNASDKVKTMSDSSDKENDFPEKEDIGKKLNSVASLLQISDVHNSVCLLSSTKEKFTSPKKISSKVLTPSHSDHNSNVLGSNLSERILSKTKFVTSTPINSKLKNLTSFNRSEHLHNDELAAIRSSAFNFRESPVVPYIDTHAFEFPLSIAVSDRSMSNLKSLSSLSSRRSATLPEKSLNSNTSKKGRSCSLVSHRESDVEEESEESAKNKLLTLCNQDSVVDFASSYNWGKLKIKKIGEGSYGEVFMLTKVRSSSVIKIIPICDEASADSYQGLQNVLSEVKISKCLSELRSNKRNNTKNFIKLNSVSLVSGVYPRVLIDAWDNFSEAKSTYNDRPDVFGPNQMFVILELEYGGKDLSACVLRNAVEAESVLKQIAVTLAVAEEEYVFEHRDLHLGNILIKRSNKKTASYKLRGKDISFECHGIQVTIIDFTLSRLHEEGYVFYNDLAQDDSLFEQSGDCQFEVYKSMRRAVKNQWETCSLYSNVLWLKFLCKKMLNFEYSRPSTAAHKKALKAVEVFHDQLLNCDSATECLTKCGITAIHFEHSSLESKSAKKSILISRNSSLKAK